jgi:flagellar protein FliS
MFMANGQFGSARTRYRNIELQGKVDGASPHKLIAVLFDELLKSLDACKVAVERGDVGRTHDRQARALSILQALDASLDFEKGGDLAKSLSSIYREGRRLVTLGVRERRADPITQARVMIGEIASAWESIT